MNFEHLNFYNGILLGIFVFAIIYNTFLYFFTKEKSAKFLVLSILFFLIYSTITLFNPIEKIKWYALMISIVYCTFFSLLFQSKFILNFLTENEESFYSKAIYSKNIKILSSIYIALSIVIVILFFIKTDAESLILDSVLRTSDLLSLSQITYLVILLIKNNGIKHKGIRFIILGQIVLISGILMSIIQVIFFDNVYDITSISVSIFLTFLSVSLADKINHLKKQKEEAQEKALLLLEDKVQERTLEVRKQKEIIEAKSKEVEEKNKDILDSIRYAKRIQTSLLPTEKFIDRILKKKDKKNE